MAAEEEPRRETQLGDLPEACLAYAIALTSPRDACRCAAVSPSFRAAADSDPVWHRFIPEDHHLGPARSKQAAERKKDAYLGLCDGGGVPVDGEGGGCRVWLEKASGAKCYALAARRLSLPWDDGEHSWRWTPDQSSRFGEVAELVDCTCLDIYGRLPTAALTPSTGYAAYLVYGTAEGHRGLSYPDQEATVAVAGRVLQRRSVCLRPDDAATRKFRGVAGPAKAEGGGGVEEEEPRRPTRRRDGWWEMELGRVAAASLAAAGGDEGVDVVASFEVLGWYLKRGLLVEAMEFRPVHTA